MTLPPEILDKILGHIPTDDEGRPTLIACALVATWWTGPSQKRLFSSILIDEGNYQRWMNGVVLSRSKIRLLGHVRSLLHCRGDFGAKYRMRDLPHDSGGYLSALRDINSLILLNIAVEHVSEEQFHICFSAFRETITHLSLSTFATSFSAFVTLVDYFPNITALELDSLALEPDEGPVPPLSRPLRGKVHVHYADHVQADFLEFHSRFAKLDLEYEELVVDSSCPMDEKPLENVLQMSAATIKFLRLTTELQCERPLSHSSKLRPYPPTHVQAKAEATIYDFRQLRELELVVTWPNSCHRALISSISSTDFRKIIFQGRHLDNRKTFAWLMGAWASIDKELCGLVGRLRAIGYQHTLEVELRLMKVGSDPEDYDFTEVFPDFRQKGVVTIIDVADGDRVLHSSTHNH